MKGKNILKCVVSSVCAALMCVGFSACGMFSQTVSVLSVEKTASDGLVDTYTITYSDGSTFQFTVTNGADGQDGADGEAGKNGVNGANGSDGRDGADGVTVYDLYEAYKEEYGDDISYADFLKSYFYYEAQDSSLEIGECLLSSVMVYTQFTESLTLCDRVPVTYDYAALYTGGGVIYKVEDEYTYILTNYHVVYDSDSTGSKISDKIYLYLYGSAPYGCPAYSPSDAEDYYRITDWVYGDYAVSCEYVGGSVSSDVAVLKAKTADMKKINPDIKAVTVADDYYVGQTAIAIGNPNGDGISVTQGIVSVDNEYIALDIDGTSRAYRSIRIDTALYSGNSGGGLFNGKGELIGLNNAGDGDDQNINFAIPVQIVTGVADNVIYYDQDGNSSTAGVYALTLDTLGLSLETNNLRYVFDAGMGYGKIRGDVAVTASIGIASSIGLTTGDVISSVTVRGKEYALNRDFDLSDILYTVRAGDTIAFSYTRNGTDSVTASYTVQSANLTAVE